MNKDKIEGVSVRMSVSKKDVNLQPRNVFRFGHFRHSSAF